MKIRSNYHTHTTFCDGVNTAEQMAQAAYALGFDHLGFSGHMDPDIHMDFGAYREEIGRLRKIYEGRMQILCGVELDCIYDPDSAPGAEYVIGSTHFLDLDTPVPMSVDSSVRSMQTLIDEYYAGDVYALTRDYYRLEAEVNDRLQCTFIGHFDLVTRFNDEMHFVDETDPRYYEPALEAMEYLISQGRPFEINCGAVNRGRKKDFYPNTFLLKKLHEMGGEILISADAHSADKLNGAFDGAAAQAAACGFTHYNILHRDEFGKVIFRQLPLCED